MKTGTTTPLFAAELDHVEGQTSPLAAYDDLPALVQRIEPDLVALRRDLHAHPELGWQEVRTTALINNRLHGLGLSTTVLEKGTGLWADIGQAATAVGLRADLDALPITDSKTVEYRSLNEGVCHACGHDVHTAVVAGAAQILSELERQGRLPGRVRVIFQPAEEKIPHSGSPEVIKAGGVHGVSRIFALHCDPGLPYGVIGTRVGPITAACDLLEVSLTGKGGHTARPHLTGDLIHALATVATDLPMALSRRVDARDGLSVVWGHVQAGHAPNAIPQSGILRGTARCLSTKAWRESPQIIQTLIEDLVRPYAVQAHVNHQRGIPAVDSDAESVELISAAAQYFLGPQAVVSAAQSMGGEDFGWYLHETSEGGAFVRLGVARPQGSQPCDIHQPNFDVDERAIAVGVTTLVGAALAALPAQTAQPE